MLSASMLSLYVVMFRAVDEHDSGVDDAGNGAAVGGIHEPFHREPSHPVGVLHDAERDGSFADPLQGVTEVVESRHQDRARPALPLQHGGCGRRPFG